jgi:hypothetical protein
MKALTINVPNITTPKTGEYITEPYKKDDDSKEK